MPTERAYTYNGVPLGKYLDERFLAAQERSDHAICSLDKRITDRFTALDKANTLALETINERLRAMNEFRGAVSDVLAKAPSKDTLDREIRRLEEMFLPIKETLAEARGKASQASVTWAYLLAGAGVVIGLASLLTKILG